VPARFRKSKSVGAVFGLTCRTHALQQLIFRFRQNAAFRRPDPSRNRPPVSSCLITTDRTRVMQQSSVNQRLACRYTQHTALNGHLESRTDRPYGALYR
jgi:hypothetical protein